MGIKVHIYEPDHEPAVRALNQRLTKGQWDQRFPESSTPDWLPPGLHPQLYNESFIAVDGDGEARGAYLLKHQEFLVNGKSLDVANYAFPLSEGVIDRKYGMTGVSMIVDAQKRNPYLFGLGMGGLGHPSVRVMKGVGWSATMVPFFFKVVHPFRFLRNIAYLRRNPLKRIALDFAAFSGVGFIGVKVLDHLATQSAPPQDLRFEIVDEFADWTNSIWEAAKPAKGITAVRDAPVLRTLYPPSDDKFHKLRVEVSSETVGWAVCLNTQMEGHSYFGNMRVGTLADCYSREGMEEAVVHAAHRYLCKAGADLIVSNQSHARWCAALKAAGYREGPSNFAITCSKKLIECAGPLEQVLPYSHFNRGDGDGPINL
jgi:hypothetical protein